MMAAGFIGTYEHSLDSKNRVFVPADFKSEIEGRLTFRFSMSKYPHIDCFLEEDFENVVKTEVDENRYNLAREHRDSIARAFAKTVSIDNGGRICVPSKLLEKSGITKETVLVGKGSFFQIWNPDTHEEYSEYLFGCALEREEAKDSERILADKRISDGKDLKSENKPKED